MNNSTRPNKPELDATKVPTEIDIAWAAGIYEGEGTCRLCGDTKRGFMITVVQKDPELLYRLRDWFGGSVREAGNKSGACTWDCYGDRARIFIALIYRFMTVRRKVQIDATGCLEFLGEVSPNNLSMTQLKAIMEKFYEDHRTNVLERKRLGKVRQYQRYAADPQWIARDRQKKAETKARKTEEDLKLDREKRNTRLRSKRKLFALSIDDTA